MNKALFALTALCFVALCACGSPGSGTSFKPPQGWNSTPGVFGRFQMWISGGNQGDRQLVILVRGDRNMSTVDTTSFSNTKNVRDLQHRKITLCGRQQADYFTGRGQSSNANMRGPQILEGVMTTIGPSKYVALYIRPAAMQPDGQAESAIRSLCPQ